MPIVAKLREFLDANRVAYSVHSHPEAFTAQEIAALSHVKGRKLAKVVVVRTGAELTMLVLPADHRVDFERPKGILGRPDVRLAEETEFRDVFPGCDVGAMPPFGNLYGLPVYVDRSLAKQDEVVFSAGTHTLTAKIAFQEFARLVSPRLEDFAVHL